MTAVSHLVLDTFHSSIEWLSTECRKVIGFVFTALHDCVTRHFFIESELNPNPIVSHSHAFSHAQVHVSYM